MRLLSILIKLLFLLLLCPLVVYIVVWPHVQHNDRSPAEENTPLMKTIWGTDHLFLHKAQSTKNKSLTLDFETLQDGGWLGGWRHTEPDS